LGRKHKNSVLKTKELGFWQKYGINIKNFSEKVSFFFNRGLKREPAYHNTTFRTYLGTIVFVVHGLISRLNKNPKAYSGCSKMLGYRY